MTTKLIFVRHAESTKNVDGILDGTNEKKYKLSEKGILQAENLKVFLKKENVDVIFSSHFERALDTIKPFSLETGIEINIDERLRETHHGNLEGIVGTGEEYKIFKKKFKEDPDYKLGETGESKNEIFKRVKEFIDEILEKYMGKTIVIVSHGYPLSIILNKLDNAKDYFSDEFKPKNAEAIILEI